MFFNFPIWLYPIANTPILYCFARFLFRPNCEISWWNFGPDHPWIKQNTPPWPESGLGCTFRYRDPWQSRVPHPSLISRHLKFTQSSALVLLNLLKCTFQGRRQDKIFELFFKKYQNLDFHYHIWILHEKHMKMNTNTPNIDAMVLEIFPWILRK